MAMPIRVAFLVATTSASLCACTLPPPASSGGVAAGGETISISRGPCFGFCPVYELSIDPRGTLRFEGLRHTASLGVRTGEPGPRAYGKVRSLLERFRPTRGTEQDLECAWVQTDTSVLTLGWETMAGEKTTLRYQLGCPGGEGPQLERALDKLLGTLESDQWARQTTRPGTPRG